MSQSAFCHLLLHCRFSATYRNQNRRRFCYRTCVFYVFYNIFISFRCPQQRINKGFDYMIRVLFGAYKGTFWGV